MNRHGRFYAAVVLLAIAVRVAAVFELQSHNVPRSTYEHGEIAANLLAGRGFAIRFLGWEGPTSQQAPIYPAILAVAYTIGGVETPRSLLLLELGQALLGGVLTLGVLRLAERIAGGRSEVILTAGIITALHPTLIYAATHVQVALLGATLLTWTLLFAYRTGASGCIHDAVGTGVLLALLALTDPILSLALAGAVLAIVQGRSQYPSGRAEAARLVSLVLAVAALGVLPWIVRNARVHGEFVAIKSTFGYAFWQGNCNLSQGTDKVVRPSVTRVLEGEAGKRGLNALNRTLWAARHEAGYLDDIALSPDDKKLLGSVSEPERSRILFHRALSELREQPGRYLALCLRRFQYFWLFDETNPKTQVLVYRVSHIALLCAAVLGLLLARRDVRSRLWPTLLTVLLIAGFHTLTIVSARFHIPIEPLMAVWAGVGLSRWAPACKRSAAPGNHIVGVGLVSGLERGKLVTLERLA
jgi:hypothetical protein